MIVLFITLAIVLPSLIMFVIALISVNRCDDETIPTISFKEFEGWYSVNPSSWKQGKYANIIIKQEGESYIPRRDSNGISHIYKEAGREYIVKVGFWDTFRLKRFWERIEENERMKSSNKELEKVLLSVQKDIEIFRREHLQ